MIKLRNFRKFARCTTCEEIRASLKAAVIQRQITDDLKLLKREHIHMVSRELLLYRKKNDQTMLHGSNYMSIIIDGSDQSAYGLPHFTIHSKAENGHSNKVRLVSLLHQRIPNKLILLTMSEEHENSDNHIIEVFHVCLNSQEKPLPENLYLQLDNCVKDNNNRYIFSFI